MAISKTELIVALDFSSQEEAFAMAEKLKGIVSWLKIGLQLFVACGPSVVTRLHNQGFNIFLDLKFYDIPNTVANAAREAANLGAGILTVHSQGGKRMCVGAMEAVANFNSPPLIACVSALTSFGKNEMPGIEESPENFAMFLAEQISAWKMRALVCSPVELPKIKNRFPYLKCICPGIRLPDNAGDDQKRIASPREAAQNGADFIVVGRPVIHSDNPGETALSIIKSLDDS